MTEWQISATLIIVGLILFDVGITQRNVTPFTLLNKKVKTLEHQILVQGKVANLAPIKAKIDSSFKAQRIDGLEREYLHARLRGIETRCTTPKSTIPRFAAGCPEDKI